MDTENKIGLSRDKLVSDLRIVVRDAEELLRNTGEHADEHFKVAKEKIEASMKNAKEKLKDASEVAKEKSKKAAETTDIYVKDHPWQAVGLSAAVGVILGFLIARK